MTPLVLPDRAGAELLEAGLVAHEQRRGAVGPRRPTPLHALAPARLVRS